MISVSSEIRINQFAQERLIRIGRVGDFIARNIIPKLASSKSNIVNLEIGCGHGHWLTSLASSRKNELFVGIDLLSKRVRKADRKKELALLDNVFFLKAEASEFLEALPKKICIKNTFVMFPDPWPKKRHHKNRLIQDSFLCLLHDKSQKESKLFFKTDHAAYFEWTKQIILESASWDLGSEAWPHNASSYFDDLFESSNSCSASYI
jgi:tRNA (guanine-N7-)-methyltransferase